MTQSGIQCENCGAVVAPGVKFCGVCGQPVGQARFCEQCGARVAPGIRFCESCGSPVGGPAPAPQAVTTPQYVSPMATTPAWQGGPPAQAWAESSPGPAAEAPRPRKKRRGCLWVLLVLVLLLVALVVAAFLLGWIAYTAGNLTIFPNGVPFIATPVPVP